MKIVAPLPPNIANGRMHWRVKLNRKHAYHETLDMLAAARQIPAPPPEPPRQATISAKLYLYSHMDDDNAMGRVKWFLDWLVTNGYLAGDSRKHLRWAGIPHQVIDRAAPRVEVTLTPTTDTRNG